MLASIPASCRVVASILPVRPLQGSLWGRVTLKRARKLGIAGYHCLEFFTEEQFGWDRCAVHEGCGDFERRVVDVADDAGDGGDSDATCDEGEWE